MRKGECCTVAHVDRGAVPWAYTVALPDGREVSTELGNLSPVIVAAASAKPKRKAKQDKSDKAWAQPQQVRAANVA